MDRDRGEATDVKPPRPNLPLVRPVARVRKEGGIDELAARIRAYGYIVVAGARSMTITLKEAVGVLPPLPPGWKAERDGRYVRQPDAPPPPPSVHLDTENTVLKVEKGVVYEMVDPRGARRSLPRDPWLDQFLAHHIAKQDETLPPYTNIRWMYPADLDWVENLEIAIEASEIGGGRAPGLGRATVVCDQNGFPLQPIFIHERIRNGVHARFFCADTVFLAKAYLNPETPGGRYIIARATLRHEEQAIRVVEEIIDQGALDDVYEGLYLNAIAAAKRKAEQIPSTGPVYFVDPRTKRS